MALINTTCTITSVSLVNTPSGGQAITITWLASGGQSFTSNDTIANVGNYVVGSSHPLTVT